LKIVFFISENLLIKTRIIAQVVPTPRKGHVPPPPDLLFCRKQRREKFLPLYDHQLELFQ